MAIRNDRMRTEIHQKSIHVLDPFTSDKFTREKLNLHDKLRNKGCKQQNRSLELYTVK
jgi:hypothetical protein